MPRPEKARDNRSKKEPRAPPIAGKNASDITKNKTQAKSNKKTFTKSGTRKNKKQNNTMSARPASIQGSSLAKQGKQAIIVHDYTPGDPEFPPELVRTINPKNANPTMASFVDLPFEVREPIYHLIFGDIPQRVKQDLRMVWRPWNDTTIWPLLKVNKRLCEEIRSYIYANIPKRIRPAWNTVAAMRPKRVPARVRALKK